MLPSTGYFKAINCPFFDSGLCERPYCHFRHVKKENFNEKVESGAILQKLVSAAVQKVLQHTESSGTTTPILENDSDKSCILPKPTYNPTPISQLTKIVSANIDLISDLPSEPRKRHIPVPYTPRKPNSLPIKRPTDLNEAETFTYIEPTVKYTPGSVENILLETYTPKGTTECTEKYLPGSEIPVQSYVPIDSGILNNKLNYIPSDKVSAKKTLEYKPITVTHKEISNITYLPTPKSLVPCFSSDDEEPNIKKRKLSNEINGFDDLGPEFDILDQILDEENVNKKPIIKSDTVDIDSKSDALSKPVENNKKSRDKEKEMKKKNSEKPSTDINKEHKSSSKDRHKHKKEKKETDRKKEKSKENKTDEHHKKQDKKYKHTKENTRNNKHHSSSSSDKHKHSSSSSKRSSSKESKHKSSKDKETKKNKQSNKNNLVDSNNEYNISYESSESDEDKIAQECMKIFEEYVPSEKPQSIEVKDEEAIIEDEYIPSKKRISRTIDKNMKVAPRAPVKPDFKVKAAQAMTERLSKVREYHESKNSTTMQKNSQTSKIDSDKPQSSSQPSSGKIRIAHVPYASTLVNAKKIIVPLSPVTSVVTPSPSLPTITQSVQKGSQRVAHLPSDKFLDRPGVLEPLASKIPANVRSTYLNLMIDECLKIYLSAIDAYARAQYEELNTSKKCSKVQIYKNSAVLTVSRLRKEVQECNGIKKTGSDCSQFQKLPQSSVGNSSNTGSWSIECKSRISDSKEFSSPRFYKNISKWILTEEQLHENGFPRPHPSKEKGKAFIFNQKKQIPPKGLIRTCCRCKKDYTVNKRGVACIKEECIYHPNRKYKIRNEVKYQCCSQDGTSDGCCVASSHVYEYVDYENLKGYVKTLLPENVSEDYGVYSLDCEMCYTTHGLDLTRITVINSDCKVVYETLVKPLHSIIDYNTRYSGITEEQMASVKTTLLEVQATLLSMFTSKTILIGHSLESDFKALKLIHDTVVDTSVLFPHKMGPPYKRALRNLTSEHLRKIIQNSVDGHDSAEDARVCMELIHYKLKEDLKTR